MASFSVTVTWIDLSVHAAITTDDGQWDGDVFTDMATRSAGALVTAYEVVAHTSARLGSELHG